MEERTDEQKVQDRKRERELHARGLVRAKTYLVNLALQCDIPVEYGPKITGAKKDPGAYVPAWLEWHLLRFPQNQITQRRRLEIVEAMKTDYNAQYMLLLEAELLGGTLYDPCGDIATAAALALLREQHGVELDT